MAYLVDVWQHTTTGNSGTDEQIEFLIASNSELQVSGSNTLNPEILGGITCTFS